MGYAQRLVERILADEKARGRRLGQQAAYRDEPLLFTGADLERFARRAQDKEARRRAEAERAKQNGKRSGARGNGTERGKRRSKTGLVKQGDIAKRAERRSTARPAEQGDLFKTAQHMPSPAPKRNPFSVDLSQLARIRSESQASCEALLTDEEREEAQGAPTAPATSGNRAHETVDASGGHARETAGTDSPLCESPDIGTPTSLGEAPSCGASTSPALLSPEETAYLACVLNHDPDEKRMQVVREAASSDAMMMDAINEKLFDELGDIALTDESGRPELIEDYRDDVRGLIFS